jgi:hypothetical protein
MPESPDPRNTFEVSVPPKFGQPFEFSFRPACPGLVVSLFSLPFIITPPTCTYQTVKISMAPRPTSPIPSARTPARKPSTPSRVSVGVSPVRAQHTRPRTLVSRGCSPVPFKELLPPDIAAFFASTQMQLTEASSVHSPIQHTDAISVTSSESESETENERVLSKSRTRPRSLTIVPDALVRPHLLVFYNLLTQFPDGPDVGRGGRVRVEASEGCKGR